MSKPINKVLLIHPPTVTEKKYYTKMISFPMGLAYIASVLKNEGYEIGMIDASLEGYTDDATVEENPKFIRFGLDPSILRKRIEEFAPDFVGISCMLSLQYPVVRRICQDIKALDRDIAVALGGPYPSYFAKDIISDNKDIDFIVIGEGEYSIRELLAAINKGKGLADIDGLAFRKNGQVFVNPKSSYIENLDELPFPERELLPMRQYNVYPPFWAIPLKGQKTTSLVTSRGCPVRCSFCYSSVYWGPYYRKRSVVNVLSEMEQLITKHGITNFHFVEDNLTFDRERAINLFKEIIKRKIKISWSAPNGVCLWTLDEEMIGLMKQSGCYALNFGIESGSQDILSKVVHKPLDLKKAEGIIREIKRNRIFTLGYFIFGFPGETKQDIQKTRTLVKKLALDRNIYFTATPFAGTELFRRCQEQKCIGTPYDESFNELFSAKFETSQFKKAELDRIILNNYRFDCFRFFLHHPLKWKMIWWPIIRYKIRSLLWQS
jgi:anaerobic magnesium-protoporphyrin IX monomethyl ester cyclase